MINVQHWCHFGKEMKWCMYTCTFISIIYHHIHVYVGIYLAHMHVHTWIYTCMHACMHARTHAHTHTHTHILTLIYTLCQRAQSRSKSPQPLSWNYWNTLTLKSVRLVYVESKVTEVMSWCQFSSGVEVFIGTMFFWFIVWGLMTSVFLKRLVFQDRDWQFHSYTSVPCSSAHAGAGWPHLCEYSRTCVSDKYSILQWAHSCLVINVLPHSEWHCFVTIISSYQFHVNVFLFLSVVCILLHPKGFSVILLVCVFCWGGGVVVVFLGGGGVGGGLQSYRFSHVVFFLLQPKGFSVMPVGLFHCSQRLTPAKRVFCYTSGVLSVVKAKKVFWDTSGIFCLFDAAV